MADRNEKAAGRPRHFDAIAEYEALRDKAGAPANAHHAFMATADTFVGTAPRHDDLTLLVAW